MPATCRGQHQICARPRSNKETGLRTLDVIVYNIARQIARDLSKKILPSDKLGFRYDAIIR